MNRKQILLIFAVILCVSYPQGISVGGSVDVNGDGVVNTADLEFVDKHIGTTGEHAADVNDDNVVNITDLVLVKNAIGTTVSEAVSGGAAIDGMVLIPAGEFVMGGNDNQAGSDEKPVHTVYLDAFYIDTHEVTNAEYKKFLDANPQWWKGGNPPIDNAYSGSYLSDWNGNNYPAGKGDHPVVYVSWYAAMAYAEWAGKRLPTEAEWEKAARGGLLGKVYPWGDTIDDTKANYNRNVGSTTPIGKYPPNGYGLYDMSGNVWEWCLDAYDSGFYARSPRKNPIAGADNITEVLNDFTNNNLTNVSRVLRGGSWTYDTRNVRVASRFGNTPSYAGDGLGGFRCARAVTP